jgi:hypothetical protein
MFISVGSGSDVAEGMKEQSIEAMRLWDLAACLGKCES